MVPFILSHFETTKTLLSFLAQISFQFLTKARIHIQIANGSKTIFSVTTVPNKITYFSWSHVAFSVDIVTKKVKFSSCLL